MKLLLIISIILLSIYNLNAQVKMIDINEVTNIALSNNIEIREKISEKEKSVMRLNEVKLFPNPSVSYSQENLRHNESKYNEWQTLLSYPINFIWERGSKISAQDKMIRYRDYNIKDIEREIIFETKSKYLKYHYSQLEHEILVLILQEIERVKLNAENRFSRGDISEYELIRIVAEVQKIKRDLKSNENQILIDLNELKTLTGISADSITTHINIENYNQVFDINFLNKTALENRPDYISLFKLEESEKHSLANNKLKTIPSINLTMGYKYQSDKLNGMVIGFDFGIPIFNRNQYLSEINKIEIKQINSEKEFLKNKILLDVTENYTKLKNIIEQRNEILKVDALMIFRTSLYSYDKGEVSIVEFIDGIKVYIELIKQRLDVEKEYINTFFKLEKTIGKKLI